MLQKGWVQVSVEALQAAAWATPGGGDDVDEVTMAMIRRGPDMFLPPEVELEARLSVLAAGIAEARRQGISPEG